MVSERFGFIFILVVIVGEMLVLYLEREVIRASGMGGVDLNGSRLHEVRNHDGLVDVSGENATLECTTHRNRNQYTSNTFELGTDLNSVSKQYLGFPYSCFPQAAPRYMS